MTETYLPKIFGLSSALQAQLNDILTKVYSSIPMHGTGLPSTTGVLEGSIFILEPANTWYQLRSGAWVAI